MVRLTDHPDMTLAVDWDIKSQTKQNQMHYTTQRTYLNEGSTTSFLVNPQEAVITKGSKMQDPKTNLACKQMITA